MEKSINISDLKSLIKETAMVGHLSIEYLKQDDFDTFCLNDNIMAIVEYGPQKRLANNIKNCPYIFVEINTYNGLGYLEIWRSNSVVKYFNFGELMLSSNGDDFFIGLNIDAANKDIKIISESIYDKIFEITVVLKLDISRIWNYIPNITSLDTDNEERYQQYCYGRSLSYSKHQSIYSSATGIGIKGNHVCVYLLATSKKKNICIENPNQTPAYKYPIKYGLKSPSFARATYTCNESSLGRLYISGTASIIGSEAVNIGDVCKQTMTTINNIEVLISKRNLENYGISVACSLRQIDFLKVYIKKVHDVDKVIELCNKFFSTKNVLYMITDICRPNLLIEIEGMIN